MTNFFKPKPLGLANEGLHTAKIIATNHVGTIKTQYGDKDMQQFVFSIKQCDDFDQQKHVVEIHQQYHRSTHRSTLTKLLIALGISVAYVDENGIDFDDLVGRTLTINVIHITNAKGVKHANVFPVPRNGGAIRTCTYGRCSKEVRIVGASTYQGRYCSETHRTMGGKS